MSLITFVLRTNGIVQVKCFEQLRRLSGKVLAVNTSIVIIKKIALSLEFLQGPLARSDPRRNGGDACATYDPFFQE